MRIIFLAIFIILGANLMIDLLDSNLTDTINERNEALERLLNPPSKVIQWLSPTPKNLKDLSNAMLR